MLIYLILLQPSGDRSSTERTLGKALLKSRGFYNDSYWYWIGIGALIGFSLLFNFLFIAALTYLNRKLSNLNIVSLHKNEVSMVTNKKCGTYISAIGDSNSTVVEEDGDKKRASGNEVEGLCPCLAIFNFFFFFLLVPPIATASD